MKKRGRHLAHADDEARHTVRKTIKKLRYGAEFFAGVFDTPRQRKRYRRFVAALETLQDDLGALNDLVTAPAALKALGLAGEPDAKRLLARGKRKALLASAADAHEDLIETRPFWR